MEIQSGWKGGVLGEVKGSVAGWREDRVQEGWGRQVGGRGGMGEERTRVELAWIPQQAGVRGWWA